MSHLPLDARAILEYLNELGYRNITAEQLKEFLKDLRKLIKYEESLDVNAHHKDFFENLYRNSTECFRAKNKSTTNDPKSPISKRPIENHLGKKLPNEWDLKKKQKIEKTARFANPDVDTQKHPASMGSIHQPPKSSELDTDRPTKRSSSKTMPSGSNPTSTRSSRSTERTTSKMWIRPRSKPPHIRKNVHHMKMDPVQLYQYYQSEWQKFKPYLPGENDRSDLRWQIRQKLLGE